MQQIIHTRRLSWEAKKKYHSGERPFSCQHWSKTFVEKLQLKYHIRVHTKQKSISCNTCGESFKNAHTLGQHQNVHTGERCFKCKICEKIIWSKRSSFKTYDNPRGIWMWPMWQILWNWTSEPSTTASQGVLWNMWEKKVSKQAEMAQIDAHRGKAI